MPHASREHADIAELKKLLKRSANEVGRSVEALGNPHRSRENPWSQQLRVREEGSRIGCNKAV